jgi:hypothetical protein
MAILLPMFVFTATLLAGEISGPLRVHPENGRYLMDKTGKAVYLTGSHVWCNFQEDISSEDPQYNIKYKDFLDVLAKYGHNFIRGWHWEDAYYRPLPFKRTGPGKAKDGKPKFDLRKYNRAYFDRIRSRAVEAGKREFYISIMLFEGWSIEDKKGGRKVNPWPYHPFNTDNNIQGVNGDPDGDGQGKEVHTLKIPAVVALQERYVKHTIDRLNDLDNIIWEISNESHLGSVKWQYHMIDLIHKYEKTKPKQHLVWMNLYSKEPSNEFLFDSPADIISPDRVKPNFRHPPPSKGDKVVILDTDHLWGVGTDGGFVWRTVTRGYYPIFMDPLHNISWYKQSWKAQDNKWVAMRKAMGYAAGYAKRIDLAKAKPLPGYCSTKYCLANPGSEYLIYQPKSGEFQVKLKAGRYKYEWFNPQKGEVVLKDTLEAVQESATFTPSFEGHAVLYICKAKR